ncbi:UvrD-helicase domain-containing protein [Microvirga sp. BT689]|uniref:UvrD-helicase domain-containing protein n=1 Tax=Microvirga arvi TaxID=2778731 RepID=UPI0019507EE6|nr:UvrD-helicase domain-containing protein [Microvirga arvi]MBM6583235.1 UvrD-helicase domain-containing protein [Microvirga arvi]
MRVQPKPLLSFLLNPFGTHARGIEYRDGALIIDARRGRTVHLQDLADPPSMKRGLLGTTVRIRTDDAIGISLKGVNYQHADTFAREVRKAWTTFNLGRFEEKRGTIDDILDTIVKLGEPTRYPAACVLSPILDEARSLETTLFSKLPTEAIGENNLGQIRRIRSFIHNASRWRDQAIAKFETEELARWENFFDTFEKNPLTPEQRLSIVADEDATLVLAGAGSGKTSVITAKAGYLVKAGIQRPDEILLLAFAKDAAREMSERIEERCGEPLEVRTFHALAYDIIGAVEGTKPALAAHATDDKAFLALIRDILRALVSTDSDASRAIIRWFSYTHLEDKSEWDFEQKHEYYTFIEKADLRTLQGERVKSFEELMIANWLFENGIEYEYEPDYEHDLPHTGRRRYCPDFRLKNSGVYIEHFGVRRKKIGDGSDKLLTAPFVDREEYLAGMAWKREVHSAYSTTLIETFSYEREESRLLEALAEKIAPFETCQPRPRETLFDRVVELNQVDSFVQLLGTFLRHYKGGGYNLADCDAKGRKLKLGRRAQAFLSIFGPVYAEYQRQLGNRIDFEDMILRASEYAENGQYRSPYRHILVDEFQDISRSRGRLVRALKSQHQNARVFAVGDDWQSIYRFAGSDINLMRDFGSEFGGTFDGRSGVHRTVDLGRTFRSVDKIAYAARKFVLKNPAQLPKTIIPAGKAIHPAIQVVSTFRHDPEEKLRQVLQALSNLAAPGNQRSSVLLLGRYKHVAPADLPKLKREFSNLDLSFRTIHSSKGLEADHVVVLNLFRGRTGFPSEIVDDPLLSLVSPDAELFDNAEERRVMYVAMTRARRTLTLMGSASKQSAFVCELLADPEYGIVTKDKGQALDEGCTECGGHLLTFPLKGGQTRYRCEHAELCGHSLSACSECGTGLPKRKDTSGEAECSCGATFCACPECQNGWLVERSSRYGPFLGCVTYPICKGRKRL